MLKRKNVLFAIFLIISIILIAGNKDSRLKKAEFVGRYIFLPYTSTLTYLRNFSRLRKKNKKLEKEIYSFQEHNRYLLEQIHQYRRISELLNQKFIKKLDFKIASVIGTSSFVNFENLLIDAGKNKNVKKNMPVVTINGIVGKITEVYPYYSVVQTFKNRYFSMGAKDHRSRINGIVSTDFCGKIYFEKLKVGSDIKLGDTIVSSKLSSIYPPEINFGEIEKIEITSNGLFIRAEVKPFVNLEKVEEVAIITKNK